MFGGGQELRFAADDVHEMRGFAEERVARVVTVALGHVSAAGDGIEYDAVFLRVDFQGIHGGTAPGAGDHLGGAAGQVPGPGSFEEECGAVGELDQRHGGIVDIILHTGRHGMRELREGTAGNGYRFRGAHEIPHAIQGMNADVDQGATAGPFLVHEPVVPAEGNAAPPCIAGLGEVNVAQFAGVDQVAQVAGFGVETHDHGIHQGALAPGGHPGHGDGFRRVHGGGFFAQHVLARGEAVDGECGVRMVRHADADRINVVAGQHFMVIDESPLDAEFG